MPRRKKDDGFVIPDEILRDAYVATAQKYDVYRDSFISRTELVKEVKFLCGPEYAHVPVDLIRERIGVCARGPEHHGGSWSAKGGHGARKLRPSPQWYQDYLKSRHWLKRKEDFLRFWGYKCAICLSDKLLAPHHRDYSRLGRELDTDCIVLCRKCHKRHHRFMPAVPEEKHAVQVQNEQPLIWDF